MPGGSNLSAIRALQMELKSLQATPVEGFTVQCDDQNVFKWTVAIFGPPGTLYQGGYFKASIKFPTNYPYAPPNLLFLSKVWHPNVYEVRLNLFPINSLFVEWRALYFYFASAS
jgi:ubiquitin-conjugating enzyme E2 R